MKLSDSQLGRLQGIVGRLSQLRDRIAQLEIDKARALAEHAEAATEYEWFQDQICGLFDIKGKATINWANGEITEETIEEVEPEVQEVGNANS